MRLYVYTSRHQNGKRVFVFCSRSQEDLSSVPLDILDHGNNIGEDNKQIVSVH